ncbi:unnamed protein product [Echinostoma caproni]|uniref:Purinergic receptor n=1 Tax=Echinostoma caproni TaxID=27848 RepID=A0A183A8A7_9TREM|nr:unnamed protein product [Echinostoma caproni]
MTRIAAHSGSRFIFARKRPHRISTAVITAGLRGFFTEVMFVFEMPKVVHIRNPALGLLFRLVQLSILTYFVIFVMWWNKGYQSFDRALSGVTAKVSGVSWVGSDRFTPGGPLVDNGAYNLRSLQNSGVYLTTRITAKAIQQLGYCAELTSLPDAHCLTDAHCTPGTTAGHSIYGPDGRMFSIEDIDLNDDGHGVFTGRCLQAMQVCEIYGWCPVRAENQTSLGRVASSSRVITPINILMEPYTFFTDLEFIQRHRSAWEPSNLKLVPPFFDVLNYTLFIRNAIEFPYFDVKRRNILQWMTEDYLHSCMYDPVSPLNQYCPVFRVYDMLRLAGANPDRMIYFGGVIAITIDWTCDLDWSVEHCLPQYAFRQLDYNPDVNQSQLIKGAGLAEGSHQELTIHFGHDGQNGTGRYRLLLNSHGIAFLIRVTGQAGKFNLLSFTMRFGSGLALLSGATIMCDLIAFHFMRDRELFREVTCDDKTLRRLLSMSTTTGSRRSQREPRPIAEHTRVITPDHFEYYIIFTG